MLPERNGANSFRARFVTWLDTRLYTISLQCSVGFRCNMFGLLVSVVAAAPRRAPRPGCRAGRRERDARGEKSSENRFA